MPSETEYIEQISSLTEKVKEYETKEIEYQTQIKEYQDKLTQNDTDIKKLQGLVMKYVTSDDKPNNEPENLSFADRYSNLLKQMKKEEK